AAVRPMALPILLQEPCLAVGRDALVGSTLELLQVAERAGARGTRAVLPRRNAIRAVDRRTCNEYHRPRLRSARFAPLSLLDEDERAGRCIEALAVDGEGRAPGED